MTVDEKTKELVKRLRVNMHAYGIAQQAADALEALAGEVERYRERHKEFMTLQNALERVAGEKVAVTAERDRLKAAITEALNNAQDRLDYDCKCKDCTGTLTTVEATLRAALGGAS